MKTQSSNDPKNQSHRDLLTSGAAVIGSTLAYRCAKCTGTI
jgi:hypothetical protein